MAEEKEEGRKSKDRMEAAGAQRGFGTLRFVRENFGPSFGCRALQLLRHGPHFGEMARVDAHQRDTGRIDPSENFRLAQDVDSNASHGRTASTTRLFLSFI